jgi:hypothetical protein
MENFNELSNTLKTFTQENPEISIAILIVFLLLLFFLFKGKSKGNSEAGLDHFNLELFKRRKGL